jgi:hypothetical protein
MPKIRDLGISVIPATMRPAEIGGGAADFEYWAQRTPCQPTDPMPMPEPGPECIPTTEPQCVGTYDDQCCPTDLPASTKEAGAATLPDPAVAQLKQQLHDQISAELLN